LSNILSEAKDPVPGKSHIEDFCKSLKLPRVLHGYLWDGTPAAVRRLSSVVLLGAVVLGLALPRQARAQAPFDVTDTWSDGGLGGWSGGGGQVTLTNGAGYLAVEFREQGYPNPVACLVRRSLTNAVVVSNLSFRFRTADDLPSCLRLQLSSRGGATWCVPLRGVTQASWTQFDIPTSYAAGWTIGPRATPEMFERDLMAVDSVGVFIMRNASTRSQSYGLDDVRIRGTQVPRSLTISGAVGYDGVQPGTILVKAQSVGGSAVTNAVTGIPASGDYRLPGLPGATEYQVTAFRDSNGNGARDFWEAAGSWTGNPARVMFADFPLVDLRLSDPTSAEAIPLWWLRRHFDIADPAVGGEPRLAAADSDGDGMSNGEEYEAGTDPTNAASTFAIYMVLPWGDTAVTDVWADEFSGEMNTQRMIVADRAVLSWPSVSGRWYALRESTGVSAEFRMTAGDIPATPPVNIYTASPGAENPRFYRLGVRRGE